MKVSAIGLVVFNSHSAIIALCAMMAAKILSCGQTGVKHIVMLIFVQES